MTRCEDGTKDDSLLANLVAAGHSLATSTITIAEIFSGLRPVEEPGTRALLDTLDKFPVSAEIAENAGRLMALLRSQGQTRSITDMFIAATAVEYGFTLATDNVRDFQMQGLALYPLP